MNEKDIKQTIDNYSKLSNDQLMAEFVKQFASQKSKDGGASMMKTIERIKPLLNAEQKKRLEEILKSVDLQH